MPKCGVTPPYARAYCRWLVVAIGARGVPALQRLFSTFPDGRPGMGLLLLRVAVGFAAVAAGVFYFSGPSLGKGALGLVLVLSGTALAIGFLTPFAGGVAGLGFLGIALSWIPGPPWGLHDTRVVALGVVVTAVAIALLGPGAFSLDGRLFGRREIVIPPSSRRTPS